MSTPTTAARLARTAKPLAAAVRSSSSASASLSSHLAMVELKQKILTSLSKLADRDTYQIAVEDLEKTIQSLSLETLPMLLNCLYDSCSDPKPAVKKESLRLLSYVCSLHRDSTATHLTKIIGQIVKRLKDSDSGVRDACRDAIGSLSGIYLKGKEEGNNVGTASSVVGLFVKPLFEAMGEQNKVVQSGASLCMAKMVESAADPPVAAFQKLCPKICKFLSSPNFMAKASLLPVVASLSQVGAIAPQSLDSLLEIIHECLGSTDWVTRKAAAEALIALASHSSSLVKDKADSTLSALEACRFDKIKPVRDSVTDALQLWKKIVGKCVDGALDEQKTSCGERLGSERTGEKRSNLADSMKKEACDGSTLNSDSSSKRTGGIPEKAVVMLKKKAPALSDKEINPEFFQRLEQRGSGDLPVEVVVPRRCKNTSDSNNEEESGHTDVDTRRSNCLKDATFLGLETRSNKQAEKRFDGKEPRTGTGGDDADAKAGLTHNETSTNHAEVSDPEVQPEGSLANNRGNWSAIQRQLLQLERQQANLMNMLQEFIGGSHDSMVTLENRVRGLERIVEDMARDLSASSGRRGNLPTGFGKYGSFSNYPTSKYNSRAPTGDRGSHHDGPVRGRTWTSDMEDDWNIPPYAASRNGSRRSPRSEHENDHVGNGRRGWEKAAGSVRFGEGPSARSVWQASKDEATLEAIRVAGDDGGAVTRAARVTAVPEAEALAEDENGLQDRDPLWTSWSNAMHSLRVGDIDSAYAEVLSMGDHHLLIKLMDKTGPAIDQLSNEIANEALNAISQFLLDHNLYDICLSWIQQLLEVIVQEGAEAFGVSMELKTEILFNLQDACSTMEPPEDWEGPAPEQLVMQLSSAWDIDPRHFDK